jgi:hypothetical protein
VNSSCMWLAPRSLCSLTRHPKSELSEVWMGDGIYKPISSGLCTSFFISTKLQATGRIRVVGVWWGRGALGTGGPCCLCFLFPLLLLLLPFLSVTAVFTSLSLTLLSYTAVVLLHYMWYCCRLRMIISVVVLSLALTVS